MTPWSKALIKYVEEKQIKKSKESLITDVTKEIDKINRQANKFRNKKYDYLGMLITISQQTELGVTEKGNISKRSMKTKPKAELIKILKTLKKFSKNFNVKDYEDYYNKQFLETHLDKITKDRNITFNNIEQKVNFTKRMIDQFNIKKDEEGYSSSPYEVAYEVTGDERYKELADDYIQTKNFVDNIYARQEERRKKNPNRPKYSSSKYRK